MRRPKIGAAVKLSILFRPVHFLGIRIGLTANRIDDPRFQMADCTAMSRKVMFAQMNLVPSRNFGVMK